MLTESLPNLFQRRVFNFHRSSVVVVPRHRYAGYLGAGSGAVAILRQAYDHAGSERVCEEVGAVSAREFIGLELD